MEREAPYASKCHTITMLSSEPDARYLPLELHRTHITTPRARRTRQLCIAKS